MTAREVISEITVSRVTAKRMKSAMTGSKVMENAPVQLKLLMKIVHVIPGGVVMIVKFSVKTGFVPRKEKIVMEALTVALIQSVFFPNVLKPAVMTVNRLCLPTLSRAL